jgi:ribosome maturation factor RimP
MAIAGYNTSFAETSEWALTNRPFFLLGRFSFEFSYSAATFVDWRPIPGCHLDSALLTESPARNMSWSLAVERTVTGMGYDLVDVERSGGGLLRVTIDRLPGQAYPTGDSEFVLIEDCEAVTRQLQYVLEVENVDFTRLEVSSPGLDRPLRKESDLGRFVGEPVEITFKVPFQGRKKFQGELLAREGGWRLRFEQQAVKRGPGSGVPKPGRLVGKGKAPQAGTAVADVEQVLDFTFDELREARLVPVIDFKGRRRPAAEPAAAAQEAAGDSPSDDGGQQQ